MAGNLIKKPHSVALCSNPTDKTQPNTWSPHTHPEHGLLDGSAKASPVPGSALGSRNCSMVVAQVASQHQGWRQGCGLSTEP